jgi:2-polyprenyl-3-methyl-5-hydroxy-6-metoxy-1,4-benzoquinol methylase
MEWTNCPMCASDQGDLFVESADLLHASTQTFRLLTCRSCGHIYQNPRPTVAAIDKHYPADYIPFQKAIDEEASAWRRFDRGFGRRRRCLAVHRAAGKPGRLLDIGCATGIFLDGMRSLGWQVHGVEPSPGAAEYARQHFGLDVFQGRLEDAGIADRSLDAVSLWDVLEHVHEPRQVLDEIARILRPGGLVVLSLPNPDSLEARLLGRFWLGWDLPRHLNLFRPLLLNTHLAKRGLVVEAIRSFTAGYPVLVMSLESRLHHAGYNTRAIGRILRSVPLRLLAMPYYAGPANWYNLSSIMVVFARRNLEKQ